jgi:branched-chain amino acid transport system substrate-binding protein
MRNQKHFAVVRKCAALVVIALMATACSSASTNSSSNGSTAAANEATLTVSVPCQISGPQPAPECLQSVQAYFDQLNASGGVAGHHLRAIGCDAQTDPVLAADCVKSALSNSSVLALLGRGGAIAPITGASIADIGPQSNTPQLGQEENSFPFDDAAATPGVSVVAKYLLGKGDNRPGILACTLAACTSDIKDISSFYAAQGVQAKGVTVPLAAVDYQPQVTELDHDKIDVVVILEGIAGIVGTLNAAAAQGGYAPSWITPFSCDDGATLAQIPGGTQNFYCATLFNPSASARAPYVTMMNKYIGVGKWKMSSQGLNAWLAAQVFVDDVKTISGPITRQSVLDGMAHLTNFTSPLLGNAIDFSKPGPADAPAYRRSAYFIAKVINHQLVTQGGEVVTGP